MDIVSWRKKQKRSKVGTSDQLKRVIISRLRSVNVSVFPDWDPWMCHFSKLRSLKVSLSQSGITDTFRDLDLEKWHIWGSQSGNNDTFRDLDLEKWHI